MPPTIRSELPADESAIDEVTRLAFESHPYSHQTEHFIIKALRKAGALSISLVAEQAGEVVGHIAFSPVEVEEGSSGWYGLGPISVLPSLQGTGIGRALMESGLAELRKLGAKGCVLVGDPAFYMRFGFANTSVLTLDGVPPEFFLSLSLSDAAARGKVMFHPAFGAEA